MKGKSKKESQGFSAGYKNHSNSGGFAPNRRASDRPDQDSGRDSWRSASDRAVGGCHVDAAITVLIVLLVACLFAHWVIYQLFGWWGFGALAIGMGVLAIAVHEAPDAEEAS